MVGTAESKWNQIKLELIAMRHIVNDVRKEASVGI